MNFAKSKAKTLKKVFKYEFNSEDGSNAVENIEIEFYEKCLTPAFLDALTKYEEKRDSVSIAKHLAKNIVSWNLDWNGEPFPPTEENLSEVCDFDFLMQLVTAISETFAGKKPTQTESPSLSAVSAQSETQAAS